MSDVKKANPTRWKKGQSGNPKGAPKRGESWKEIATRIGNLTGTEAAAMCAAMGSRFKDFPEGVTLKELAILAAFGDAINNPTPGIMRVLWEMSGGEDGEAQGGITIQINGSKWTPN